MNRSEYRCVDGSVHSPLPWKVVRSEIPYYTWIMDSTGGMVCIGFGRSDESLLLAAPVLLAACELALAQSDPSLPVHDDLMAAVAMARGKA